MAETRLVGAGGGDPLSAVVPIRLGLALIAPATLVALVLWLPFGFQLIGLIEEWDVLGLFSVHGRFFVADATSPLAAHSLRPLTVLPHAIANYLDPNSFAYWHLLLIAGLVIKGAAASYLLWKMTGSLGWAMFGGMLMLIYPADTMQLSFRSFHINLCVAAVLLAASLQAGATGEKRPGRSAAMAGCAAALLMAAILMYESALLLVPVPFLVVFVRDGLGEAWQSVRRRWLLASMWIVPVGVYAVFILVAASHRNSYHSALTGSAGVFSIVQNALPKLFSIGIPRALAGGWFDAFWIVLREFESHLYLWGAVVVCVALGFLARCAALGPVHRWKNTTLPRRMAVRLVITGLVLMVLGYLPYLLSNAHLVINQRTFLVSTPGAVFAWTGVLIAVASLSRKVAGFLAIGLLFLGLGSQLFQFNHYQQVADVQRGLLRSIVENFDGNLEDKTLVILDASSRLNHTWMLRDNLRWALSYLYDRPIDAVEICLTPGGFWQRLDSLGRAGACVEDATNWYFRSASPVSGPSLALSSQPPDLQIPKHEVMLLEIKPNGTVTQNPELDGYRSKLASEQSNPAIRYRQILAPSQWRFPFAQFASAQAKHRYRWDFGDWWSMELPIRGTGWREADWTIGYFRHNAQVWKSQAESSLIFDFTPEAGMYLVEGRFDIFVNEEIRKSLQIRLNGRTLPHRWLDDGRFEAPVPVGVLLTQGNSVEFHSSVASDYYGLSARLDWLEVRPRHD